MSGSQKNDVKMHWKLIRWLLGTSEFAWLVMISKCGLRSEKNALIKTVRTVSFCEFIKRQWFFFHSGIKSWDAHQLNIISQESWTMKGTKRTKSIQYSQRANISQQGFMGAVQKCMVSLSSNQVLCVSDKRTH